MNTVKNLHPDDIDILTFLLEEKIPTEPSENGCLLWTGRINNGGYGYFFLKKKTHLAHRLLWILRKGDIPRGQEIRHACKNKRCVNINHLAYTLTVPTYNRRSEAIFDLLGESKLWGSVYDSAHDSRSNEQCVALFRSQQDEWRVKVNEYLKTAPQVSQLCFKVNDAMMEFLDNKKYYLGYLDFLQLQNRYWYCQRDPKFKYVKDSTYNKNKKYYKKYRHNLENL